MNKRSGENLDEAVVNGFGREWSTFDQTAVSSDELRAIFDQYFALFPWSTLAADATGFDLGCGSGRWAQFCAPRVGQLHCIDPSEAALAVARKNLVGAGNCVFHHAGVDDLPFEHGSMDFAYALGVLHHIPDTCAGIQACVEKLKPGAPCLLYLYYAFDNRPLWFKAVWRLSDGLRRVISRAPHPLKYAASLIIALGVYLPLSLAARGFERLGFGVEMLPLSAYASKSFYTMRTDALDRFGTRREHRFTKEAIERMMGDAGLENISFADEAPFWCAIGYKVLEP